MDLETRLEGGSIAPPPVRFFSAEPFDRPLADSTHFRCVGSLGSLLPGWALITPKRAVINLTALSDDEKIDLQTFATDIQSALERRFGPVCLFEHGAMARGSETGCGVDQAHLHLVPISAEAFVGAVKTHYEWQTTLARLPHDLGAPRKEYLWYSADGRASVAFPTRPMSQFFRRMIARTLGKPDHWDYRAYPHLDNVKATQVALTGAFSAPEKRAG